MISRARARARAEGVRPTATFVPIARSVPNSKLGVAGASRPGS